ncbi:MAG: bacterial Ig-like domain-containing protein [Oscillospiraceae bacterium]|nr:bacterial Ig-like domain-containing protein [Oscillospiraceae bacterium]
MKARKICIRAMSLLLSAAMLMPLFCVKAGNAMKAGQDCIDLIKEAEGFSQYKYWDYSQWTIGYGTGVGADEYPDGITEEEAEQLLKDALGTYEGYVNKFADKYDIELKQNQFDALVSLSYNMGNIWSAYDDFDLKNYLIDGSEKHSFLEIAKGFGEWRKAGGSVLQGLVNRREEETKLFLSDRTDSDSEIWRVNTESGINLREDAGTSAEKSGFLMYNTIYEVTEKKMCDGSLWGKTYADGKEQWCVLDFSKYMVGGPIDYEGGSENTGKSEKWRITSENGVNLREGPGLGYKSLDVLDYKTEFSVTNTVEADEHIWGKTRYNNKDGWVALTYAERVSDQEFEAAVLTGIYLKSEPEKKKYNEGDMLSLEGIEVVAKYSDGTEKTVTDFTVDGYEPTAGEHEVVITYMEKTAKFKVTVSKKQLKKIEITTPPTKTVYKQGEELDTTGMVVEAVYDNDSREEIIDYAVGELDSTAGTKTIQVEYKDFKAYFVVEVTEKQMTKLAITRLPDKTEYVLGQQLDLTGMIVYAYFDNGSKNQITAYSFDGYNPQIEGVQTITIAYNGFRQSFDVTVSEPDMYELPGDVNDDGVRDIFDLVLLNRFINEGREEFPSDRVYLADINGDGLYDQKDLDALSRIVSEQ